MNIHIITSSYPADPEDPSGTAGLFVRQFALELAERGHTVVVQPVARKDKYSGDPGVTIVPAPWRGGDRELASMDMVSLRNWLVFLPFFLNGARNTIGISDRYRIERTLCMWAVPSGIFGLIGKRRRNIPYDVWALGSDIWKIGKVPLVGKKILRVVARNAERVFADGVGLCEEVKALTDVRCDFLPSARKLPPPGNKIVFGDEGTLKHFLFVGRYHKNKGPDLLIKAVACLPPDLRESMRVHLFGLGPLEGELRSMIEELGLKKYIDLKGPVRAQEFSDYLHSVSFLVIPSRVESIPVVFSDSLQNGTPVVSMPVGDLTRLIREFRCGIVAEEASPESLASALVKAMATDKATFREGAARAYEQFEVKRAVDKWLDFGKERL